MKITDKRVLLYYIINIFMVLNMMIILFSSIILLQAGKVQSLGVFKFFFNTLFFTALSKGFIALILRLPKKEQIVLFLMSFAFSIFIALMSVLMTVFNPQIILQLTLLFWSVFTILYNYAVLKNIRQYLPLVVLTSIYAFYSVALLIIMFIDIYKLFFDTNAILTGALSIIIVFVSLEMLQLLAYVLIPEYYSKSAETIDLFDEIKIKYEIRERIIEEQEEIRMQKVVQRRMREKQKQGERELIKEERNLKRRKIKKDIKPLTRSKLNKYLEKINKNKHKE